MGGCHHHHTDPAADGGGLVIRQLGGGGSLNSEPLAFMNVIDGESSDTRRVVHYSPHPWGSSMYCPVLQ